MVRLAKGPQVQKGYKPSKQVQQLLNEKLRLLKKSKSSKLWDKRKFDFLERLFQSYADMIYFLEITASNPELYNVFKKDLMDFFDMRPTRDLRPLHPMFGVHQSGIRIVERAFTRLIYASVVPHDDPWDKDFQNDRLKLLDTLQSVIYVKMRYLFRNTYGVNSQIYTSALRDLENVVGWVAIRGKDIPEEDYTPKRFLDFHSPYFPKKPVSKKKN